ncbi:hypothetical protein MTQ12_00080 [Brevibacterium sp. R8603A2]|uniref:hypothetical protein n=1 Tax=Brevibacterium sp. R8603A2 TaxID=2929779 RepID=UPI001FF97BD6|nr:hypothetical protein [Brevibacterium sp. R8603A2]MCK1801457.1 hypothetical protein [Brevibacterium sp. R8603A2]
MLVLTFVLLAFVLSCGLVLSCGCGAVVLGAVERGDAGAVGTGDPRLDGGPDATGRML